SIRFVMTSLMQEMGLYVAALEEAGKAVEAARMLKDKDPLFLSGALAVQGNAQLNLCEYANARKSFEEALRTQPKTANDLNRANMYMGYGYALVTTSDAELARQFFKQAWPIIKQKGSFLSQAQLANAIGVVETELGHYPQATTWFSQALEAQSVATPKRE